MLEKKREMFFSFDYVAKRKQATGVALTSLSHAYMITGTNMKRDLDHKHFKGKCLTYEWLVCKV